jgi:hypothetical protein
MKTNNDVFNLCVSICVLLIIVAGALYVCDRWGVESEPCAINAPMERSQCRATHPKIALKMMVCERRQNEKRN